MPKLFLKRITALSIDLLLGLLLGYLFSNNISFYFLPKFSALFQINHYAKMLPLPTVLNLRPYGFYLSVLPISLLLVWVSEVLFRTSPGKYLLGLQISGYKNAGLLYLRLIIRSILKLGIFWV